MSKITYQQIEKAIDWFNKNGVSAKDVEESWNRTLAENFWDGFDIHFELVLRLLESYDSNELAKYSVWDFIEVFKNALTEKAAELKRSLK